MKFKNSVKWPYNRNWFIHNSDDFCLKISPMALQSTQINEIEAQIAERYTCLDYLEIVWKFRKAIFDYFKVIWVSGNDHRW